MRHLTPFVCDDCHEVVRYPDDRVKQSLAFHTWDSKKWLRRIHQANLCWTCMEKRLAEMGS